MKKGHTPALESLQAKLFMYVLNVDPTKDVHWVLHQPCEVGLREEKQKTGLECCMSERGFELGSP